MLYNMIQKCKNVKKVSTFTRNFRNIDAHEKRKITVRLAFG